ncbi:hypothetical protein Vafri_1650, partial [Volvox africanus]
GAVVMTLASEGCSVRLRCPPKQDEKFILRAPYRNKALLDSFLTAVYRCLGFRRLSPYLPVQHPTTAAISVQYIYIYIWLCRSSVSASAPALPSPFSSATS